MRTIKKYITYIASLFLIMMTAVSVAYAIESLSAWDWAKQTDQDLSVYLVQQQRSYDSNGNVSGLEDYQDYSILIPLVDSAQYNGSNFDKYGMPMADGYVDHIVRVKNTGTAEAYVRVIVAIPSILDDANESGSNILHWNLGNRFMADGSFSETNSINTSFDDISWEFYDQILIDDIQHNLYVFTYCKPLAPNSTTDAAAFVGYYLDKNVNVVNGHLLLDGIDTGFTDEDVLVRVAAQAVQSYGFHSAEHAFAHAELPENVWLKDYEKPYVQTHEELEKALTDGWNEIILANGIILNDIVTPASQIHSNTDAEIKLDLNGKVITNASNRIDDGTIRNNIYFRFEKTNVMITGNGSMLAETGLDDNPCLILGHTNSKVTIESGYFNAANGHAVWANNGHVIINGGIFESYGPNTSNDGEELIYAHGENALIEINGGFFRRDTPDLTLNELNSGGTILVRGGTFVNFDPSNGNDGNYVDDGYKVISEMQENGEIWYTVVPE